MNKFYAIFFVISILAIQGLTLGKDANKTAAGQPDAQEKSLWDKISSASKDLEAFAGKNAPRPLSPDANKSEIDNFKKALETYKKDVLKLVLPLFELSKEYYNKYPRGAFAGDNFELLQTMLAGIVNLNDGVLGGADEDFYNRLCQDKNLTADQAGELFWINVIRLRRLIESPKDNNEPDKKAIEAQFDKIEKQINDFGQKFKSQGIMLQGIFQTANGIENLYPQRSLKILELAAKYASGDDKKRLDGLIRNIGILGTAPQIKFKAIDSNEVDLSKLKGKVVLVDFWATWCPPCLEELPNVLETYKKYHDKGFEIIGISFDKDIDTVKKFVKEKGMVWPQYADGKFWDNDLGVYFGIQQIPTTWLVDKSGKVVDKDMRGSELAAKVAKLLGIDK